MAGKESPAEERTGAYVEIIEHPQPYGYRFRYGCEGNTAGSIAGEKTEGKNKTFPSFKIHNVPEGWTPQTVVSCVTTDQPYCPHPHKLVGRNCSKGVCTVSSNKTNLYVLKQLGIQCVKKKEIGESLNQRQEVRVDPFNTGSERRGEYDLRRIRLAIQPFLRDGSGGIQHVDPVVTNIINDHKIGNELMIYKMDRHSSKARGGQEVYILTEKVFKDDIRVQFYEEDEEGQLIWEDWGQFGTEDIHKQYAIILKTPPYKDQEITQQKEVLVRLYKPSDDYFSEPKKFLYRPNEFGKRGMKITDSSPVQIPDVPQLAAFKTEHKEFAEATGIQGHSGDQALSTATTTVQSICQVASMPDEAVVFSMLDRERSTQCASHLQKLLSPNNTDKISQNPTLSPIHQHVPPTAADDSDNNQLHPPSSQIVELSLLNSNIPGADVDPTLQPEACSGVVRNPELEDERSTMVQYLDFDPEIIASALESDSVPSSSFVDSQDITSVEMIVDFNTTNDQDLEQYLNQ